MKYKTHVCLITKTDYLKECLFLIVVLNASYKVTGLKIFTNKRIVFHLFKFLIISEGLQNFDERLMF